MRNVFTIDADIKLKMLINEPTVVQNDAIRFIIRVFDNGQPLDLTSVETASLANVRLDRKTVVTPGTKIGTNTVQFDLGTEETKVPGRVEATAQFYDEDGRVSTIAFTYRVVKDPTGYGYIPTEREQTLIEIVLGEGPLVIQQAKDAANFANEQGQFAQTQADYAKSQGDYAKAQGDYAKSQAELIDEKASSEDLMQLDNKVNEHLEEDVTQREGVHGFRVIYGKGQYYDKIVGKWKDVEARPHDKKIYGLEWNQTLDTYQRLEDAVGMVAITQGQNDFSSVYPWSEMKRCNLTDDGTVTAYYGDPTYKDDGSNGQVMVQIPKFWYKSEMINEGGNKIYRWWIADKELKDFKLHPAFVRNGVEKDFIYIGAYEGYVSGGMLHSRSGVTPTTNRTIVQFRQDAQARGAIWHQQDFLTTCAIQLLYLIEYAHFDSQSKIGQGITNDIVYHQTGETTQYGNQSFGDPNNATVAMSYRGIENLYGNYWNWVDGININNRRAYIADHNFESDKFDEHYRQVGFTNAASNGYVKDIGWTPQDNFMFLSIDSSGSASSYLHDYYYQNTGARVASFGGTRDNGSRAGAFCWTLSYESSYSLSAVGARLLCIP